MLQVDTAFTDSSRGHGAYNVVLPPSALEQEALAAAAASVQNAVGTVQSAILGNLQQLTALCAAASSREEELARLRLERLQLVGR